MPKLPSWRAVIVSALFVLFMGLYVGPLGAVKLHDAVAKSSVASAEKFLEGGSSVYKKILPKDHSRLELAEYAVPSRYVALRKANREDITAGSDEPFRLIGRTFPQFEESRSTSVEPSRVAKAPAKAKVRKKKHLRRVVAAVQHQKRPSAPKGP